MDKVEKILRYYLLTNKLKDTIRTGWKYWNVKKPRLESVAEHVYGTCMLAIAIWSETLPTVNLAEVLMTLAVHETEEIIIGDLTPFDAEYKTKKAKGEDAVKQIFSGMMAEEVFVTLIKNFDEQSTDEAKFAYKVDKLECDIQAKIYDEQKYLKLENANDKVKKDPFIKKISEKGVKEAYKYFIYMDKTKLQKKDEEDIFSEIIKYLEKHNLPKI